MDFIAVYDAKNKLPPYNDPAKGLSEAHWPHQCFPRGGEVGGGGEGAAPASQLYAEL